MKRAAILLPLLCLGLAAMAQTVTGDLLNRTLRLDYIFSGDSAGSEISLDELRSSEGWYGRTVNMADVPVKGNGQITVRDAATSKVLYRTSFSTLFNEWQLTEEATKTRRSFENVFLVPMPSAEADITVELFSPHGDLQSSLTHRVDPSDVMIRPLVPSGAPTRVLHKGTLDNCIDVVILAEGYTAAEAETFYADAAVAVESILAHEPFGPMADCFNFVAVALPSEDSGVSVPQRGEWKSSPLSSHFNTFYMDRYLTTLHLKDMHNALAGIPYEHIIVLANTDYYGGGGIYNSYTLTTAHHAMFRPVVVHEFGHSFGALADEYYYDDMYSEWYFPDVEPWEKNLTTKVDFESKWKDMLLTGVPGVDLLEGGGYSSKGVWRPAEDCRMHTNSCGAFCPVCQRAISEMIRFYTR